MSALLSRERLHAICCARRDDRRAVHAAVDQPVRRLHAHRPRHRPAAAGQRVARGRADDRAPAARSVVDRSAAAAIMTTRVAGRPAAAAATDGRRALAPDSVTALVSAHRPGARGGREDRARPQLRRRAGQSRRRRPRPVHARAASDLHRLSASRTSRSSSRIRRRGTSAVILVADIALDRARADGGAGAQRRRRIPAYCQRVGWHLVPGVF